MSTYRVGPYPALEGTKRVLAAVAVVIMIVTVTLADRSAGIVVAVLCSWLPIAILLHFLNFGRLTKHERLELNETSIRHLRKDRLIQEMKWEEVTGFFYDDDPRGGWGFVLCSAEKTIVLREDYVPFDELLIEVSNFTGIPVPSRDRPVMSPSDGPEAKVDEEPDPRP